MTKKEMKKLAKEIAKYERILKQSDGDERYMAEKTIMTLTNKVENMDDMMAIDELVMEFLEQEN